jgi:Cof subfamily protein (haloacid dehalogenase superfamily)
VILARRINKKVVVSAEILDRWYTDRVDERFVTETAKTFGPDMIAPIGEWLTQDITKLLLLAPGAAIEELVAAITAELPLQVSMVRTEPHLLQIMHATVSKAQALRCVAAELVVARENVMAIGDNANDVGMLQWAAFGVAVGNATDEVKAVAKLVTAANDEDGVAEAVEKIILCGRRK